MQSHISLEIPVRKQDAARRGLRSSLAKLLVGVDNESEFPALLSYVLDRWRPSAVEILICAENPFNCLSKISGIDREQVFLYENLAAARVASARDVVALVTQWVAEAHVIFFGNEATLMQVAAVARQPLGLLDSSTSNSFQGIYLTKADVSDPFIFLAHGHPSVEVIGSKSAILRAFDSIRDLFAAEGQSIIL